MLPEPLYRRALHIVRQVLRLSQAARAAYVAAACRNDAELTRAVQELLTKYEHSIRAIDLESRLRPPHEPRDLDSDFAERYRLDDPIGEGGMGIVFKAWDYQFDRSVVVKKIRESKVGSTAARKRFRQEALAAGRVQHPGIEPVYNIEVDGDHCYRVGRQGLLVHNQSCPKMPTFKTVGTFTVKPTWYKGGTAPITRYRGVEAILLGEGFPRTDLDTPKWWNDFTAAHSMHTWEKGHVIASQYGGPTNERNLVAQHMTFNRSPWQTCENAIAKSLEDCGCVQVIIAIDYPAGVQDVVPTRFRVIAKGLGGNDTDIDVDLRNTPAERTPSECSRRLR